MARGVVAAPEPYRLKFKHSLKGCTNAELLKRVKQLHLELASIDQDVVVTESIDKVAKELISHTLLLHKEKGVRAYLACCLADILRLYAPEAPYTEVELKDLFQFLFQQLKNLTTAQEPHFSEYFYLIESLSNVKSIVLVCDLDSADELMSTIFKQCFDVISSESPKNVEIAMADILMQLIEEPQTLSSDVIDTLLAQFLPKNVKHKTAAYRLAVDVCEGMSDKLQRYVCQYFAETITANISKVNYSSDEDEDEGPASNAKGTGKLPAAFITAHALIKQLNRSVPSLLLNVIPQLEEELSAEKPEYRKLATETLGAMLGEKIGQGDLARKYPATWKAWLSRSKDKVVGVRIAMVESLKKIWTEHSELGADIEGAVSRIMADGDEKVRIAACRVFLELDYETACHHVSTNILKELGERCQDRKASVREVALDALGRLYNLAFPEIEARDPDAILHFAWIPSVVVQILLCDASLQRLIKVEVENTIFNHILPLPSKDEEESQWVDRFSIVLQHMDDNNTSALLSLMNWLERSPYGPYVDACEKNNGGIIDEDEAKIKEYLKQVTRAIATSMPDPNQATTDLNRFAKANEKQTYKLLRTLIDPQSDLQTLIKSNKECLRRIEQISTSLLPTFKTFIRRSSYFMLNRSSISPLIKRLSVQSGSDSKIFAQVAERLLRHIAKLRPALFKSNVHELSKSLADGGEESLVTVALHSLSRLAKTDLVTRPEKKLVERAQHYARTGTPQQAKYAATIIALDSSRPGSSDDLVEFLADALDTAEISEQVSHLAALSRLARHAQEASESKSSEITTFLLRDVLMKPIVDAIDEDGNETAVWASGSEIDEDVHCRLLAIKILTNRCIANANSDTADEVSAPVFKLLYGLLQMKESETAHIDAVRARMRLAAALALLKLATAGLTYQTQLATKFDVLAWTAQDVDFDVRSKFIIKLIAYLRSGKIVAAPKYNVILFLIAHDPEADIKASARSYITNKFRLSPPQVRSNQFEHPFVRLLHLLAHHPDFVQGDDEEEIKLMSKYIELYLDCIANAENVAFLFHLALKCKTIRTKEGFEYDNNLYILSELAQHLIKARSNTNSWSLPTYPHGTKMPNDIFQSLDSVIEAKKIMSKSYLSTETLQALGPVGKNAPRPKAQAAVKVKAERKAMESKKRKSPTTKSKPKTRVTKNAEPKWAEDSDETPEEEDESSDSDSEMEGGDKLPAKKVQKVVTESKRAGLRGKAASAGAKKAVVEDEDEDEEMEE